MTITVNTPDGGQASFPDGTDPGTITSAMQAKFGGPDSGGDSKPLFSLTGTDKVGEFVGKMSDAATAGFGAKALDALGLGQGPGGQTVAKQVQAAGQDIGPVGSALADVAGYAVPGVGLGGRLAKGAEALGAGSRVAAGLGGAGESAILTGAGDIGHDKTPGMDVLYAGALGGGLGAAAKAAPKPTVGGSIADLQAAKQAAIDTADKTPVAGSVAAKDVSAARNTLTPGEQSGLSGPMKGKLDDIQDLIANNQDLTARDVWAMRSSLNDAVKSSKDTIASKRVGDALYNLAPDEIGNASMAHAKLADATWLQNTTDPAALVAGAKARLAPDSGMLMDPTTQQAMQNLANSGPGWLTRRAAGVAGTGVNMGTGALLGGGVGDMALGALLGTEKGSSSMGAGLKNLILNAGTSRARRAALAAMGVQTPPSVGARAGALASGAATPLRTMLNAGGLAGMYGSSN